MAPPPALLWGVEMTAAPFVRLGVSCVLRRYIIATYPNLSRLHYHSLQFHMIAQTGSRWASGASAVAAGAVVTTFQACNVTHESQLHSNDLDLPAPLRIDVTQPSQPLVKLSLDNIVKVRVKSPVAQWSWPLAEGKQTAVTFSYAPVLICKSPKGTVGLGDAISASGLAAHLPSSSNQQ